MGSKTRGSNGKRRIPTSSERAVREPLHHHSFGWLRLGTAGGRLLPVFPEGQGLQFVEVDIDDRRRIKSENLRQSQAADNGIAKRLANLRADFGTYYHR